VTLELIPFKGALVPKNKKVAGMVICIPGDTGYEGAAVLCLTEEALYLCSPDGITFSLLYDYVQDVDICDLEGITITRQTELGPRRIEPDPAYGIELTYERPNEIKNRLRILVFFRDKAEQWAAIIRLAVNTWRSGQPVVFSIEIIE
jgi:hypothetical protein